jgi:hypothetical protein
VAESERSAVAEAPLSVTPVTLVPVRLVDARPPYPLLARYRLLAVPRPGDGIMIDFEGRRVPYRVIFVNFDPFNDLTHITLGCLPSAEAGNGKEVSEAKLKQQMDDYVDSQHRLFERADAYAKAILLAGYAGLFGIWSFARDVLTATVTEWVALLVGISLVLYITWGIIQMITGTTRRYQFNLLVNNNPRDFFKALADRRATERSILIRDNRIWLFVLIPMVVFGYAGAALLLWKVAVKLLGW